MRQFDVVDNPAERLRRFAPFLVVLQSHYLIGIDTTVVAPLFLPSAIPADGVFALSVEFEAQPLTLAVQQLFSTPAKRLGRVKGSLDRFDLDIARAWERLFVGF